MGINWFGRGRDEFTLGILPKTKLVGWKEPLPGFWPLGRPQLIFFLNFGPRKVPKLVPRVGLKGIYQGRFYSTQLWGQKKVGKN